MYNNDIIITSDSMKYSSTDLAYCTYYCDNYVEPNCNHLALPESEYSDFWSHIELGAGNYGLDGHTKVSQHKTVLMELKYVSEAPNYVDSLPEHDEKLYDPNHQYAVLFDSLDKLVQKLGPKGIFHVNDLFEDYTTHTVRMLQDYAKARGYSNIIIEGVSGDYTTLLPTHTLGKYGKFLYDSAHLKNPEVSFYNYGMDGDNMLSDSNSRANARAKLQTLANLAHNGLHFFPIDPRNIFIPKEEYREFINQQIFYQPTNQWESVSYYFPEGPIIPAQFDHEELGNVQLGNVYSIAHNYTCGGNYILYTNTSIYG